MEYLALIGSVTIVHLFAAMSPGPDFIMTVRNALSYSRKAGIWTAIGLGLGVSIYLFYSLAGLALIISKSIVLFHTIKLLGVAYLIYIGFRSFFSKTSVVQIKEEDGGKGMTPMEALKMGFLTNVLNPKVTLFFLSLFTFIITPETPNFVLAIMSTIMIINTMIWFSLVAVFLSQKHVRSLFEGFQGIFNKTLGGLLIALGVKVAFAKK